MELLNLDKNPKTVKGQKSGYMTAILYLSPHTLSGVNVCPMAEIAGCVHTCLNYTGRAGMSKDSTVFAADNGKYIPNNNIQRARMRRTKLFIEDRQGFLTQLEKEIKSFIRRTVKKGYTPVIRLNGTSDIRWENVRFNDGSTIFSRFPDITFYDYTKIPNRRHIPDNYYLCWSYSEASKKYAAMRPYNMNWVVVFNGKKLPDTFLGRPVVNGDEHDLRFIDPANVVVGLKAKGVNKIKKNNNGFIVQLAA